MRYYIIKRTNGTKSSVHFRDKKTGGKGLAFVSCLYPIDRRLRYGSQLLSYIVYFVTPVSGLIVTVMAPTAVRVFGPF